MTELWCRRRWMDFRNGHVVYLAFGMQFINFILIAYNFGMNRLFSNVLLFGCGLAAIYIPLAIVIGHWHRRKQYHVDTEMQWQENWLWASVASIQIRMADGTAADEEVEKVKSILDRIAKRHSI